MDLFGPILEILKCIGPPLYKYIEYHRKLDEYKEKLGKELVDLNGRREDIRLSLNMERDRGKLPKKEVEDWLESTEGIISEARNIEQRAIRKGKFFSRAHLGELVDKKIQEVKEYYQKGSSFNTLVIDAPPASGTMLPTMELAGQTTTMDEIWGYLMDNKVKNIGVYGMGGVGKTTLMMHINNRLLKEATDKFDNIIWVTVSQTVDVIKLQKEIASALNKELPKTKDKIRRAGILLEMLQKKRFVLILDDVWEKIEFQELGIPEQDGSKLVITTRSKDVCRSMNCKPVMVKLLPYNEALDLFLKKVGYDLLQIPTLKEIMESIVKQCAGLPLAIVTISSSMKGVYEVHEWRNALNELSNNIKSVKGENDEIFERLRFSYDRLNDNKVQYCFLYCALYPEDYNIPRHELVNSWIMEGLIDEMDNVQDAEDKAHSILSRLINNSLLLESKGHFGEAAVKLHDVVRDMMLTYITSKSPIFMVKAGLKLHELPNEQEWKENVEKVSLMDNSIREIPSDASPNSLRLSTLLLQNNRRLDRISSSFFMHMKELKVINLSCTGISSLPDSISNLTNLTTLLLEGCSMLKDVPSLANLTALKNLNLGGTRIKNVPKGFERLTNLRNLDLSSESLRELPIGVLPKLRYLRKFKIIWGSKTLPATIREAAALKKLGTFVAYFDNLQDFELYMKCLKVHNQVPNKYFIGRAPILISHVLLFNRNLDDIPFFDKYIVLMDNNICEREDSVLLLEDVQWLHLSRCNDVISISDVPSFDTLKRLESLWLHQLPNLTLLFEISKLPRFPYSNLKILWIYNCDKLKNLFSSKLLPELKNLEQIYIYMCKGMEEIIAMNVDEEEEEEKELSLPKLRILSLRNNPNLKRVCGSNGMMVCDSLQEIEIFRCDHLISRLPFRLPTDENGRPTPPPALKKIEVEGQWWEALDPNSKILLLPYCQFFFSFPLWWYESRVYYGNRTSHL